MPKLTKRVVDAAEPRERQYTVWCSELRGFGIFVHPTGKKAYFVDYRTAEGVRRRMVIGPHGVLTAEEARKLAMATLGSTVRGEDPAGERTTRRTSMTVRELCDDYLAAAERGLISGKRGLPKKASTLATDRGRIESHVVPLLGRKLVRDLTKADVARFIASVTTGKTAKVEKSGKLRGVSRVTGGRGTAARTAGLLGSILSFAVVHGVIETNPVAGVKVPAYETRTRRLSPEDYRALGKALAAAEADGERWQAITGLWLLTLTGCRLGEIAGLEWAEVDTAGQALRLIDSKEGASVRPVGRPVLDVLEGIPPENRQSQYVLPAARRAEGHFGSLDGAVDRIMAKAELVGVTAHTLRHSFASTAGDLGYSEHTIAAMLGHAAGSVTSRYVHHLDAVLVAAADKVARTIRAQMTGETGKVMSLPRRRSKE